jgi:putative membrane protein
MKSFISFIIIACVLALAFAFAASNDQFVDFNYLIAQDSFKFSYLLIGAFITGFSLAIASLGLLFIKLKLSVGRLSRKSKRQVTELEKLRTAAVKV